MLQDMQAIATSLGPMVLALELHVIRVRKGRCSATSHAARLQDRRCLQPATCSAARLSQYWAA